MTKVADFIEWMDDEEHVSQLMAECIMLTKRPVVEMMDHASFDRCKSKDADALLGTTFHHAFDVFLDESKESRGDGKTWYQAMEEDQEPDDPGIIEQDAINEFNARTPL